MRNGLLNGLTSAVPRYSSRAILESPINQPSPVTEGHQQLIRNQGESS